FPLANLLAQMIGKTAGELENGLGRRAIGDERRVAFPAYLDPGEEIGLGAGEPVEACGFEAQIAENLAVRREGEAGAAPVGRRAHLFEWPKRVAARKALAEQLAIARHLDISLDRERVDDADADTM